MRIRLGFRVQAVFSLISGFEGAGGKGWAREAGSERVVSVLRRLHLGSIGPEPHIFVQRQCKMHAKHKDRYVCKEISKPKVPKPCRPLNREELSIYEPSQQNR